MEVITNLVLELLSEVPQSSINSNFHERTKRNEKRTRKILMLTNLLKDRSLKANIRRIPKSVNYFQIIENFDSKIFSSHFRMSKYAFLKLVDEIETLSTTTIGHPKVEVKKSLYITVWALANRNCFRELSDRFDVSISTAYEIVIRTCKIILKLSKKYIKFPRTVLEINTTIENFNKVRSIGFPNVVGCIDGMHVYIKAPSVDASSYYNRKGRHSMVLQGVCNADLSFSNVFFGWPGRCHDAYIFANSEIGKALNEKRICLPPDAHIIGDSAYPLSTFLMTPFRDNGYLTQNQKFYNQQLSSTRILIEQAFGRLKAKFRILDGLNFNNLANIKNIVMACVILHNFIISEDYEENNNENFNYNNNNGESINENNDENNSGFSNSNIDVTAAHKRNYLCQLISC